jgi:hypothetical protein
MVIYAKGSDPEALERSSRLLREYSRECERTRADAGSAVRALEGHWGGGDLQALTERWPAADAQLAQLGGQLGDLSRRLSANARQQRGASAPVADVHSMSATAGAATPGSPSVGHTDPRPEKHWWDTLGDKAGDAAAWTYNHTVVPTVNGLANVGQAMVEHPEDVLAMALGAGAIVLGAGGEVGGVALDATGVGAVAGVPINIASAGLIATGVATMAAGGGDLLNNASKNDNQVLDEAKGPSESKPQPGDRIPDENRPSTAGDGWEGRVSDNGKGEVWQKPENVNAPPGTPKNANSVRIMDGTERYPDGYVRFYNEHGQPLKLDGKPGANNSPDTHVPVRPDGTYDIPAGWNP